MRREKARVYFDIVPLEAMAELASSMTLLAQHDHPAGTALHGIHPTLGPLVLVQAEGTVCIVTALAPLPAPPQAAA